MSHPVPKVIVSRFFSANDVGASLCVRSISRLAIQQARNRTESAADRTDGPATALGHSLFGIHLACRAGRAGKTSGIQGVNP
jgi:hypothetical protein